jgi:hypothetical protein
MKAVYLLRVSRKNYNDAILIFAKKEDAVLELKSRAELNSLTIESEDYAYGNNLEVSIARKALQ